MRQSLEIFNYKQYVPPMATKKYPIFIPLQRV